MDTTIGEGALWAASLRGDSAAFGVLFDTHHARVHRHATRLLPIRADADDVSAAAFLELWRRRQHVRLIHDSILPWLLVTTTNLARNTTRSTRRYRDLLHRLPHHHSSPDAAATAEAAGLHDEQLITALAQLKKIDLHLLTLVVLEGYTLIEAADLLQLSPTAAKTRVHRARTRLRTALADHPAAGRLPAPEGQPA